MYASIKKYFIQQEIEEKIKPANKLSYYLTKFQLFNPIGTFKRGYDISFANRTENSKSEKIILVHEKPFSNRLRFILFLMIVQSISFSFVMTASISLPWTFNFVIPFTLDFLPPELIVLLDSFIHFIQGLLKPLDPLVSIFKELIEFFSNFNPSLLFVATFWFFDYLGLINADKYLSIPNDYNNGSKTGIDILAYNLEQKFSFLGNNVIPFIVIMFSVISFFFLITKTKKLLFELIKDKNFNKHKKKIRKTLLSYYMNLNVVDMVYIKNGSSRIKLIKRFYHSMILLAILTSLSPLFLALVVIFL